MKMDDITNSKILLESIHTDVIRENELNLKLGMYFIVLVHSISILSLAKNAKYR